MELTTFIRDYNLSFPLVVLPTIFFIILITKLFYLKNIKNLPPGPPQLPIIGNLHQVGAKPHVSIADLAKRYGRLISLRFGSQLVVVASSPEAAIGILKTQDQLLSARPVPNLVKHAHLLPHSVMWSECNQTWKSLRTLLRTGVFSRKALEAQSGLRNEKVSQLLNFLRKKQGEEIDIEEVVFTTLFNTLSSIILGKDLLDLNAEQGTHDGLKESLHKVIEYAGFTNDLSSVYPMLERFDLQGIRSGTLKQYDKMFSYWKDIVEERRAQELFIPGTNTTTSAVVWAMSELVRHKEVRSKIEEEIKKEINSHETTNFQLSKLTYLQACIKETFRLHPPVPLLLPHKAVETCEVMNYTIPKDTMIFVNVWAIGHDAKIWDEPLSFKPERFMDSRLDFKGQDFELIPFGSGRRMCPGSPSGVSSLESILASLIREFDWALPNGDDPSKLDMNDKFGIATKRSKPLKLIFKQKQSN
ncbi:hypothetical protein L1987_11763 [Smallanthus sonchifolius]|uniref:Uncharacterized protein n=1 Tax=Smallanthus sonchifolius TaxID=185202 RepID=A0ACB9JE11_9ASTR|nr:hypothetical protein L1987_11763 [Smallanthus sonchifolius]